jgi:ATP-binding cassette, subfamily B, bacterial
MAGRTGAAFQDFVHFQLVASEAVGVGDLPAVDDLERVGASARQAGADRVIERLVLDEPTASLDPRAEHEVFATFAAMSRRGPGGPVTILVSHRFSTVRMADLIVVLHDGRIEEQGSHDELLAAGGRYAQLFRMQASRY